MNIIGGQITVPLVHLLSNCNVVGMSGACIVSFSDFIAIVPPDKQSVSEVI